jgi:hypothetical protein
MTEAYYTVSVDASAPQPDDEEFEDLSEILNELEAHGASVGYNREDGTLGAVFSIFVDDYERDSLEVAARRSLEAFTSAATKIGMELGPINRLELLAGPSFERWLNTPPEEFAGVAELAKIFGVSRQRMSELRTRRDFPAPVAELASGPVWRVANLTRFLETWERRPGRPRKAVRA